MARTLSSTIATVVAKERLAIRHLLEFTAGSTYRFSEEGFTFDGSVYLPRLEFDDGISYQEEVGVQPFSIRISNISLETSTLLQTEQPALFGIEVTLKRAFLEANEAVLLLSGRIAAVELDQFTASFSIVPELDPASVYVPIRKYGPTCSFDFKGFGCDYVDGVDPDDPTTGLPFVVCPKTLLACIDRGRSHRFPGFLHITRILEATLTPSPGGYGLPRELPETE
jgi:hypothetical protein